MNEDSFHLGIKGLIRNQAGELLLVRVSPKHTGGRDYWDLPGGRMHKGSSVEATLRREIEEEIGVRDVEIGRRVDMILSTIRIPLQNGSDVGLILSIYACRIPADADLTLSGEHTEREWCPPEAAAARLSAKFPPEFCQLIAAL